MNVGAGMVLSIAHGRTAGVSTLMMMLFFFTLAECPLELLHSARRRQQLGLEVHVRVVFGRTLVCDMLLVFWMV